MADELLTAQIDIPYVDVVGEENVSTDPLTVSVVLNGARLEAVNKIRRALATNRETLLDGDHNFGTNQDAVNWLIDQVAKTIGAI